MENVVNLNGWQGQNRARARIGARLTVAALVSLVALAGVASCGKKDKDSGGSGGTGTASGTGTGPSTPSKGEIVIGHFASLTGAQATFGISTDNGIKLAIKERNAKGGVKGRMLKLETLDDAGKQSEAATAVTRLINDSKAVAI